MARPSRIRADDGAAHRHGVGDRLRRRTADHRGRGGRPDGRYARRAGARRRARAPRPHRRGRARRDADDRGRGRDDRRAGDPVLRVRRAHGPAGRGRRVPLRGRRRVGRRSTSTPTPCHARRAPNGARARTKEDAAAALRADGIAAWPVVPGHLAVDDPQLVAAPVLPDDRQPDGRRACLPDVSDDVVGRARTPTGPRPRRRSASTPTRCCTRSVSPTPSSPRCASGTSSAPCPSRRAELGLRTLGSGIGLSRIARQTDARAGTRAR